MVKYKKIAYAFTTTSVGFTSILFSQWQGILDPDLQGTGLPTTSVGEILNTVLLWLLSLLAILAVLMIVISGLLYIISGGNEDRINTAKSILAYAIIGLVVALLGLTLVNLVNSILFGEEF